MLADRDYIKTEKRGKKRKKQIANKFISFFVNCLKKFFFKTKFISSKINNSDLNKLLKKVSKQGIESLTHQEKMQLNKISKKLK